MQFYNYVCFFFSRVTQVKTLTLNNKTGQLCEYFLHGVACKDQINDWY